MTELFDTTKFHQLYRSKKAGSGLTASTVKLSLPRVKPGRLRILTHVTVEDKTSAYTKCRLAIDNGGNVFYLDELESPAAGELGIARSDVVLGEADVFFAELTGTTTADLLEMTCCGWEQSL